MEDQPKQSLKLQPKGSQGLRLSESKESKRKLDSLMMGCFASQKLYGRDPGNSEAITEMFHAMLAPYPASHCLRAFEIWLERSQEFPTPANIIGIIKRKGKPPLKESGIIAIRKKDGEFRTREEWAMLREWEAEQVEGWDLPDEQKHEAMVQENIRLRQQVRTLTAETERLSGLLHQARVAKGLEPVKPSLAERIAATVRVMRAGGASEDDIAMFEASHGAAA